MAFTIDGMLAQEIQAIYDADYLQTSNEKLYFDQFSNLQSSNLQKPRLVVTVIPPSSVEDDIAFIREAYRRKRERERMQEGHA